MYSLQTLSWQIVLCISAMPFLSTHTQHVPVLNLVSKSENLLHVYTDNWSFILTCVKLWEAEITGLARSQTFPGTWGIMRQRFRLRLPLFLFLTSAWWKLADFPPNGFTLALMNEGARSGWNVKMPPADFDQVLGSCCRGFVVRRNHQTIQQCLQEKKGKRGPSTVEMGIHIWIRLRVGEIVYGWWSH